MDFKSLGLRTDLIFHRFGAQVSDRGDYVAIRTASRPDYLWGNCILIRRFGAADSADHWIRIFEREIGSRKETGFMTFAWDDPTGSAEHITPFLDLGFKLSTSTIFTATAVRRPSAYNDDFVVRPLESDADWEQYLDVHFSKDWGYGSLEDQHRFNLAQRDSLRAMVQAGIGMRYGAFLGDCLVAELGIYWDRDVARFNNVGTRASHRRRGACSTLVYEASKATFSDMKRKTLVLEALSGGEAARLYGTVGFTPSQQLCKVEWLA